MANPIDSDWVDVPHQSEESDWQDVSTSQAQTQKPESFGESVLSTAKDFSPISALNQIPPLLGKVAGKVGEGATEALSQGPNRTDPYTAAAVGTMASMAPDIAMMGANPISEASIASKAVPEIATGFGRRAMGFMKPMLKTPYARGQAQKAAQVALGNDVIPWSGNPETTLDNASQLANKSGQAIGKALENTPADLNGAMSHLDNAREEITQGFSGGLYQKAHSLIDDVQSNIRQLIQKASPSDITDKFTGTVKPILGKPVNANEINQIKTRLGRSINYLADLASQSDNKTVVNNLANSVRESVKAALPPAEYADFIKNQKLFNTAELMKKGLNNEVAGQQGNRMFSPYSVIPAAGELAAGNPVAAAATMGLMEGGLRRSAGTTARALTEGYRAAPAGAEIASKAAAIKKPAPHGQMVEQDGVKYKWNGFDYVEVR